LKNQSFLNLPELTLFLILSGILKNKIW
jgi:hypothetical protein